MDINGVYWGYNPLANLLLTSWDIQVLLMVQKSQGQPPEMVVKPVANNELNYQPQLVIAGFLPKTSCSHVPYFSGKSNREIPLNHIFDCMTRLFDDFP